MARDGDHTVKPQRYARTDEYLEVLKQEWTALKPFDHAGQFYNVKGGFAAIKPQNVPAFFGGSSEEAIAVAGKHADVYATWGETQEQTREIIGRIRHSAAKHGRSGLGFSLSLRPVIADTEEAAWRKADDIVEQVKEARLAAGLPISGHTPANVGAQRLLQTAAANRRDGRLWTGVAALTGAQGNSTGLVGTPEQVSDALLDYYDLGVDHFLIRGFDPLADAIDYGRALLPLTREKAARRLEEGAVLAS
jgi:alkanesulfonate monooxygenase